MASLPNSNAVSYEQWLGMPEVSDAIEEVVDGEIRIMPPATVLRRWIAALLNGIFLSQFDIKRVVVFTPSFGLVIRKVPLTSRIPDLAVYEVASMVQKDGYMHSAPQLLVEVLSPANTRREREEKLNDYAAIGVPEVWVVSPEARTVEVLYLEDNCLRSNRVLANGTLTPKLFPHVKVEIAKIWPD
jgi:Uma2 family endonuclease